MSGLPARHVIVVFSCFERPRVEAEKIFKSMEEHGDGNEWIVVLDQDYGAPMMESTDILVVLVRQKNRFALVEH